MLGTCASRISRRLILLTSAASVAVSSSAFAANGVWTNLAGGDWSSAATGNWAGGVVASGPGGIADFNTLDLNGQVAVNLAEPITIGRLTFGDTNTATAGSWLLSGSPLTLSGTPTITVNPLEATSSARIDSTLTGTTGFTKSGTGTLVLGDTAMSASLTGAIVHGGGTISTFSGFSNSLSVSAGATATVTTRVNGGFGPVGAAGAGAVLNVRNELVFGTVNANGNWATGTALSRVNFGTTYASGDGQGYVDLRINGGAFTAASLGNTHVDLSNTILWTRTNSGGNTVNLGALSGDATSVLSGGGQGGGTVARYVVGALNTNTTFAGNIDISSAPTPFGGLDFNKVGSGTLTLSGNLLYQPTNNANSSRRGGITTVTAGTLKLTNNAAIPGGINDGTLGDIYSIVDLRNGANLDVSGAASLYSTANLQRVIGTGNVAGDYRHDEGQLAAGDTIIGTTNGTTAVAGTLHFLNNLTIDGGSILQDVNASTADLITVGGSLTLGGSATVVPNLIGVSAGTYTIASAASVSGDVSGWTVTWNGRGSAPTLTTTATELKMTVTAAGAPITWTGAASSNWDVNSTLNWRNDTTNVSDKYFEGDTVTFADTAGGNPVTVTAVSLNTAVSPVEVHVTSNTNNYTLSGSGKISGNAKVFKSGTSTLTLSTANDYIGGTTITGGIVNIGSTANALGATSSAVSLSNATIQNAGVAVNNPLTVPAGATGTLDFNGAASTGSLITFSSFAGDGTIQIVGVSSGRLIDTGTTTAFTGDISILPSILPDTTQGTFKVRMSDSNGDFPNSSVTLGAGTTLTNRATSGQTLEIGELHGAVGSVLKGYEGGSTARVSTFQIGGLNTDSTFSGTITNATGSSNTGAATDLLKTGIGKLTLNGNVSSVTTSGGTTHLYSGQLILAQGSLVLGPNMHSVIFGDGGVAVSATPGGADVRSGKLTLDYTGGSSPAASVQSILDAGFDLPTKFLTGSIRSTTLDAAHVLGWKDTGTAVEVAYTLPGDTDLNFTVNFDDLLALAQNYDAEGTNKVWAQGDVNYDAVVNFDDLLALAQNYNANAITADQSAALGNAFAADWALARSLVPEPSCLGLLGGGLLMGRRRR